VAQIVIAEEEFWQPGVDFAAAMRLRGHETLRLVADPRKDPLQRRWWRCATRTVPQATTPGGALTASGQAVLRHDTASDIQATEAVARWLDASGHEQRLGYVRSHPLAPSQVIDKLEMTRHLAAAGIPVPSTWTNASDIPPASPGPFMIKARTLGGGAGIHLLPDLRSVLEYKEHHQAEAHIIQQFVSGTPLDSAGVARAGRLVQVITYTNRVNPDRPFAAAYGITTTDDPVLRDYTALVVDALGITGPFALDAVPGPGGQPLIVDLNLRMWGCWTACQDLGMQVTASYEFALGLGEDPGSFRTPAGRYAPILRRPPLDVSTPSQRSLWVRRELAHIWRRRRWLGAHWARAASYETLAWAARGVPVLSSASG
jgi:hypothetical protein